jgi:hypothetical protein
VKNSIKSAAPLLLAVIPDGTARARLRALRGHAVAVAINAVWRVKSVGFDLGSYDATYISRRGWRMYSPLVPVDCRNPLMIYRR